MHPLRNQPPKIKPNSRDYIDGYLQYLEPDSNDSLSLHQNLDQYKQEVSRQEDNEIK